MDITYQSVLVLLSIGIAIFGSLTSLAIMAGAADDGGVSAAGEPSWDDDEDGDSWERAFGLANGSLIMGTTIWAMHFIGMMAVQLPVLINFRIGETVLSIAIAVAATAAGFYVVSRRRLGWFSIPGAALLMGLGIASMHYLGMSAIRGCGLAYDFGLVGCSVAIAIVASMAALWFAFVRRSAMATLAGGVVQGLAIASMHYTAMAATGFVQPDDPVALATPVFSQSQLAFLIAGTMVVVCTGNLLLHAFMSLQRRTA